jgi:hypothetical protein
MKVWTRTALGVLITGLAACASTPSIKVGWDQHADFSKYHRWAWKPDGSIQDAVWAKRCQDVLSDQLATNGLTQVGLDQNPDLWAVVHARLSTQTQVVSYSPAWGYGWGPYGAAWAYDNTVEYQVPVGTILVDLVDVRQKEIVWRGRANGAIQSDRTNEQREEKLIAIFKEMFAGYPPGTPPAK